jgi:hypothetical protein
MFMRTLAPALLVVAACGTSNTSNTDPPLTMKDVKPTMAIVSKLEIGGSAVNVHFTARDSAYQLKSGDTLTVTAGSTAPVALTAGDDGYDGHLTIKDSGTPVTIALDCSLGKAPSSTVKMTEQLGMTGPVAGTSLSRANDDVVLTWGSDPSKDPLVASWTGPCVDDGSMPVDHTATTFTIPRGSVKANATGGSCDVVFSITRTRTGTLDPAFGGGTITHSFGSSVHITSTP